MATRQPHEELLFSRFIRDGFSRVLKGGTLISREVPLYAANLLLQREVYELMNSSEQGRAVGQGVIGRIDVIFQYQGKVFIGEIKWQPFSSGDFWDAMKVIGYKHYLDWQTQFNVNKKTTHPAIIMPIARIKLEHKIMANKIGIYIFGAQKTDKGYSMELVLNPNSLS